MIYIMYDPSRLHSGQEITRQMSKNVSPSENAAGNPLEISSGNPLDK